MVEIGSKLRLIGEIIKLDELSTIIQCFEETATALELNDHVYNLHYPLSMELGPGILNSIFDGIQRPLKKIASISGNFIRRGIKVPALDRNQIWHFVPSKNVDDIVSEGDIIGSVMEGSIEHMIMVPFGVSGIISSIQEADITIKDPAYSIAIHGGDEIKEFTLMQRWPIREPRPYTNRLMPDNPLITGTRVIDLLFPIAAGGTVAIPGGFGTGKTITQQSLAKFAHADIIVYIGCGERGNEMAETLETFPELEDPRVSSSINGTNDFNWKYQ